VLVLAAGHTFGATEGGSGIDVFAFTTFASSEFVNRDFGVTPEQSMISGLPVTDLDGGYRSTGLSAVGRWSMGSRWQVVGEAGYERYGADISDSPIAGGDDEYEMGVSLVWVF
jgi:outer membrane scaffolding protein for murein synthesis (MipA/OmpV family)